MKQFKKNLSAILAFSFLFAHTPAALAISDINVKNVKVERSESSLLLDMDLDAMGAKMKSNREVKYTPMIVAGDSVRILPSVIFAGRNRYIQNQRHNTVGKTGAVLSRVGKTVNYSTVTPYEPWMEYSHLVLNEDECGCGISLKNLDNPSDNDLGVLDFRPRVFDPMFVLVNPPAEIEKVREVSGSAYIDFPVNRTEIYPDYRRNPVELKKIQQTIDVVANDKDTEITSIQIKGFASPEGSYANNVRLASGRASSLAEYVRGLYRFNAKLMNVSSEPENWIGLRDYLSNCTLTDTTAMLAIVDNTNLEPDAREAELKRRFPTQYRFLLENVYPGLRRSDYAIEYKVRSYTTVEEIEAVMKTDPKKLSIDEIYFVANTYDPESPEFREAFELAVRLFPNNEASNLNMAAIALGRDELQAASGYLDKAGNSPSALYARGVYAYKKGDLDNGKALIKTAADAGLAEAKDALQQIELIENTDSTKILK